MIRILPLFALAACHPVPPAPAPAPPEGRCDAEGVQELAGRPRGEAVGRQALERSGAATLRWIAPGQMVTMEYREDRLNLYTDEDGRITRVSCG